AGRAVPRRAETSAPRRAPVESRLRRRVSCSRDGRDGRPRPLLPWVSAPLSRTQVLSRVRAGLVQPAYATPAFPAPGWVLRRRSRRRTRASRLALQTTCTRFVYGAAVWAARGRVVRRERLRVCVASPARTRANSVRQRR